MPTSIEATEYLQKNGVLFAPGKASNAGGVATSALEMSQNSMRLSWSFEEVDEKLKGIMNNIFNQAADAAEKYGFGNNYVAGANIAGCRCHVGGRRILIIHTVYKKTAGQCPAVFASILKSNRFILDFYYKFYTLYL